eukprot:CAMPEP_0182531838 /NCGR_PEP_ID=MMETSP1323-20130603/10182_1 /TAXON_ID=236787 /ORGANISM="Florenciella parvula, Strain RCC1693" /LENGTH=131 /DNA_ID=CAMNT_0024741481 /DNA_START=289 /DNA_END=682 /DNA_ORIENTATION=-
MFRPSPPSHPPPFVAKGDAAILVTVHLEHTPNARALDLVRTSNREDHGVKRGLYGSEDEHLRAAASCDLARRRGHSHVHAGAAGGDHAAAGSRGDERHGGDRKSENDDATELHGNGGGGGRGGRKVGEYVV